MKKWYVICFLLLLLVLCACGGQGETAPAGEDQTVSADKEKTPPAHGSTVEGDGYTLTRPVGCSAEEQAKGELVILLDGEIIGGVTQQTYDRFALPMSLDEIDFTDAVFDDILAQILQENETMHNYSYSGSLYGEFALSFSTDQREENHYFFPDGDELYDLWLKESDLTGEEENLLLSSFAISRD